MLNRKLSVKNMNLDVDIYVKNLHDNSDATFFSVEKKLLLAQRSLDWIFEVNIDTVVSVQQIISFLEHGLHNANRDNRCISAG